jgi:hypothetical protein
MRLIRILVATAIAVLVPVLTATTAHATIKGPCTASGTINGATYFASQPSAAIPRKGDVHWKGAINNGGRGKRNIEGKVQLELPPPFGKVVIGNGSWNGPSSRYANQDTYHYDLPAVLIGPKFTLSGHHAERGTVVCTGSMDIRITGSKLKNPVLLASLVLTLFSVINVGFVLVAKGP